MIPYFLLISSYQDWRSLTQRPKNRGLSLSRSVIRPLFESLVQRTVTDFLLSFYPSSAFPLRPLGLDLLHRSRSPPSILVLFFRIVQQRAIGRSIISVQTHHSLTLYAGFYEVNEGIVRMQGRILNGRAYVVRIFYLFIVFSTLATHSSCKTKRGSKS